MDYFAVCISLFTLAASYSVAGSASAQVSAEAQIEVVRRLLPTGATDGLEFVLPAADGEVVHEAGDGNWTCRGDKPGDAGLSIGCYTRTLAPMLARHRELQSEGVRGAAMRELVDREFRAGELTVQGPGLELSMSGTLGADGALPTEFTVYYLLYTPFATPATIGISAAKPDDPTVPFLHHPGTHESHVMWMEKVRLDSDG